MRTSEKGFSTFQTAKHTYYTYEANNRLYDVLVGHVNKNKFYMTSCVVVTEPCWFHKKIEEVYNLTKSKGR